MLNFILALILLLAPQHDFHTSWMNMTYDEDSKSFETTWRTDTEHFEGVLTAFEGKEINLEIALINSHKELINKYINSNVDLQINSKGQELEVHLIEVTFAETIVHFTPIKHRNKIKTISMSNSLLQARFPNQKNMVQINYCGKMYSMLLGGSKLFDEVEIN
jgi:hypothetical protein